MGGSSEGEGGRIKYFDEAVKAVASLDMAEINRAIELLLGVKSTNRIYLCGNGGSASNASHFACDLAKAGFDVICLSDNTALVTAITNDNGFTHLFYEQMGFFKKGDVLICFSVHGGEGRDKTGPWSQNLLKAVDRAQDKGGVVVSFVGYDGGVLKEMSDICILVPFRSTPIVESLHTLVFHYIFARLKGEL